MWFSIAAEIEVDATVLKEEDEVERHIQAMLEKTSGITNVGTVAAEELKGA